jgi:hypothetical protein
MATLLAPQPEAARQLAFAPSGAPRSAALAVRELRIIAQPLFLPGPPPASVRLLMPHPRSQTGGRNLRYFVQDEKGDGHCFYRAIARGVLGDPELYKEMREAMCGFMLEDANWQGFADFAALQFSGAIGSAAHRAAFYAYMEPHRYGSEHGDEPQHLAFRLMYPDTALHVWRKNDIHQHIWRKNDCDITFPMPVKRRHAGAHSRCVSRGWRVRPARQPTQQRCIKSYTVRGHGGPLYFPIWRRTQRTQRTPFCEFADAVVFLEPLRACELAFRQYSPHHLRCLCA